MIDFEKWHGNGNDFVIVNSIETKTKISKNLITKISCLLYTSPSPRDRTRSRMPSSA